MSLVGLAAILATSLSAGSVTCATAPGSGALPNSSTWSSCPSYVSTAPFTPPFAVADYLYWGASSPSGFGDGVDLGFNPPGYAQTTGGIGVAVTANLTGYSGLELQRADDSYYVYSSTNHKWEVLSSAPDLAHAAQSYGNFRAPSSPGDTPIYGDQLLGNSTGAGTITVTFPTTAVYDAALRISSATSADFMATMLAYDGTTLVGSSGLLTSGDPGGVCGSLTTLNASNNPVPCDTAPLLAIGGDGPITSVVISANGASGIWLDTLMLDADNPNPTPEPGMLFLLGGGLGLVFLSRLRKTRASR